MKVDKAKKWCYFLSEMLDNFIEKKSLLVLLLACVYARFSFWLDDTQEKICNQGRFYENPFEFFGDDVTVAVR